MYAFVNAILHIGSGTHWINRNYSPTSSSLLYVYIRVQPAIPSPPAGKSHSMYLKD